MTLPIYYRLWQPPTDLGFNTNIMAGFDGLQPRKGLGMNFNLSQVPTPKTNKLNLNSALGIAGGIAGGLVDLYQGINADTSDIENAVDQQVDALGNIKYTNATSMDDLMNKQSSYRGLEANHKASEFYQGSSTGGTFANALSKGASAAMSASSTSPIGMAIAGGLSFAGSLAGGLIGRNKQQKVADSETARLNAEERRKNAFMEASYRTDADNLVTKNNRNLMSQIAAYGGPLGISLNPVHGAIDFMQNEELLDSLEGDTTKTNRKTSLPEFAFGGALGGYGGDWSNGLTFIKAGGTHGQNPLGGVPAGVAQDGMPNLVEQGEAIWNDYVFSNRLKVPKRVLEKYKFGGDLGLTFAQAVEKAQKNSAERPNDPIEKRGLDVILADLMQEQEAIRQMKAQREQYRQLENEAAFAADGGPIHIAKNKRGTFTAAAKKHGMGVQEFASKVLANKEDYSPTMVKKANFTRNASKWSHALGGHLFDGGGHFDEYGNWVPDDGGFNFQETMNNDFQLTRVPGNPWNVEEENVEEENVLGTDRAKAIYSLGTPGTTNTARNYWWNTTGKNYGLQSKDFKAAVRVNKNDSTNPLPTSGWESYLRYAPALGSALLVGHTLANKPDYSYANELEEAANQYVGGLNTNITPKFLGDYLAYRPFDRLFYANELGVQQAANRSAIMNAGNANRGATMAALLGSGYNDNVGLGKLFREGEEYNLAQRQKVADFNRGTNQYNSTLDMQAQEINARANMAKAEALLNNKYRVLGMKQAIDNQRDQSTSLALTNLFNNLGGIGEDYANRFDRNMLINADLFGTLSNKPYGVSDADWKNYVDAHNKIYGTTNKIYGTTVEAHGGKLNRKKKKGLTI